MISIGLQYNSDVWQLFSAISEISVDIIIMTNLAILEGMEARFAEVQKLVKPDRAKVKKFGQVFTPQKIVDEMLDRVSDEEWKRHDLTTHDMCSGYGQFTIRILRRRYELMHEDFDILHFLYEYHLFSEIQLELCQHIFYIFGKQIRMLIGDISKMNLLPDEAEHGIWVIENDVWHDRTKKILKTQLISFL